MSHLDHYTRERYGDVNFAAELEGRPKPLPALTPTEQAHHRKTLAEALMRQRNPWDCHPDDAAKAYLLDMMPDGAQWSG